VEFGQKRDGRTSSPPLAELVEVGADDQKTKRRRKGRRRWSLDLVHHSLGTPEGMGVLLKQVKRILDHEFATNALQALRMNSRPRMCKSRAEERSGA